MVVSSLVMVTFLAEEPAQVVVAADAPAVDEGLGRGRHAVFGLEGIDRLARGQPAVVDDVAPALQQVTGLQPSRAGMAGHDHPIEDGSSGRVGHDALLGLAIQSSDPRFRTQVRSQS
jgi:hypothetical protein